ncbi:hypothetical protein [Streptomyces cellulosae]|uniref:Uncharacterized protein n=1 Tax=Streptomyces cellulosae TaxID=1968 RepID=A0ABW7YF63_STRCE
MDGPYQVAAFAPAAATVGDRVGWGGAHSAVVCAVLWLRAVGVAPTG